MSSHQEKLPVLDDYDENGGKLPPKFVNPEHQALNIFEKAMIGVKMTKKILDVAQIPETTWNEQLNDNDLPFYILDPIAGAGNYAIDEIKSLPVLLTMGLSMLDKEVSQEFFKSLSELGWKDLEKIFISKIEEYNDPDRVYYTASYDGVSLIVGIVTGISGAKKLLTEVRRLLKKIKKNTEIDWDLIKQNNPDLDVEEFSKEISNIDSDDLLDAIKERPELVNAMGKLSNAPDAIRKSVNHLTTVSKWSDEGIELTFEAIEDGAKIVSKNG